MSDMAKIPPMTSTTVPLRTVLTEILEFGDDVNNVLVGLAQSYFNDYGVEMPDEIWHDSTLNILIAYQNYSIDEIIECLENVKKYARDYHNNYTPRFSIDNDISKATLYKIAKQTVLGDRLNLMALDSVSFNKNVYNNVICQPALDLIIKYLKKGTSDVIRAFGNQNKANYIAERLAEIYKNRLSL